MLSCPTGQRQNQGSRARGQELSSLHHAGRQPRGRGCPKRGGFSWLAVAAPEQSREGRLREGTQARRQRHTANLQSSLRPD